MKSNLYVVLLLVIGTFSTFDVSAQQQDPQFSMFMFNQTYYNPAAVGAEGVPRFQLVHRTQYAGYQGVDNGGSQGTQLFSFNMPLKGIRSGVGLYALNDKVGPQGYQSVQIAYAYRLAIKSGTLALGVQGGIYNQSIDYSILRPGEPGDPLLADGKVNGTQPDLTAGLYYSTNDYYVGASLKHINQSVFRLGTTVGVNPLNQTANLMAGYRYQWNDALELMPSVLYKFVVKPDPSVEASSYEVNLMGMYEKRYWVGAGYRQREGFMATVGLSLLQNNSLRLGYAIDLITGNQSAKSPTSHEILLSYALPEPRAGRKPIIRTPRFRY